MTFLGEIGSHCELGCHAGSCTPSPLHYQSSSTFPRTSTTYSRGLPFFPLHLHSSRAWSIHSPTAPLVYRVRGVRVIIFLWCIPKKWHSKERREFQDVYAVFSYSKRVGRTDLNMTPVLLWVWSVACKHVQRRKTGVNLCCRFYWIHCP